jgi:hypothetical protein
MCGTDDRALDEKAGLARPFSLELDGQWLAWPTRKGEQMIPDIGGEDPSEKQGKTQPRRKAKPRPSILETLSSEDLHTLRLDESARSDFDAHVQRFSLSRLDLQTFEGEDVASMDEARYDQLLKAQARQSVDATAVVHFLAPRILRLREGAAKRKWRSFLTKFRKDEELR